MLTMFYPNAFLCIFRVFNNLHSDMIQARVIQANSDFGVKLAIVQFYTNGHNFQSNRWIRLKFCERFPDISIYLWSKFQVNRSPRSHYFSSRNLLWKFCYILPFDLWTSYLVRILFLPLKGIQLPILGGFHLLQGLLMKAIKEELKEDLEWKNFFFRKGFLSLFIKDFDYNREFWAWIIL